MSPLNNHNSYFICHFLNPGSRFFLFFFLILPALNVFSQKNNDTLKTFIQNSGIAINTNFDDYAPVISADGLTLYFTSKRPITEKEIKNNKPIKEHVFVSFYDSIKKNWSNAIVVESLKNPMPRRRNSSAIALSKDGKKILLFQDDIYGNGDIYESTFDGKNWSSQSNFGDSINSDDHESSASLSPDGNTIYVVSNRAKGFGGRDIWYSTKAPNGQWNTITNIGKPINTAKDEECVFAHPDGKTLYFSSKGHKGLGGYDVFKTSWNDSSKTWSVPVNIGKPINTKGDDLFYVEAANGKKAFYSSINPKDKIKDRDIFEIIIPQIQKTKPNKPIKVPTLVKQKIILFKGLIIDGKDKHPLSALVELYNLDIQKQTSQINTSSIDGAYHIQIDTIGHYSLHVSSKEYSYYSENITITTNDSNNTSATIIIEKNIELNKIVVGESFIMNNIYFDLDRATLKKESRNELNKLLEFLINNPTVEIEISGYTDAVGSPAYNLKLSKERAISVKKYLIKSGQVYAQRVKCKGYGESRPIESNANHFGREKNRRTEFKILKIK